MKLFYFILRIHFAYLFTTITGQVENKNRQEWNGDAGEDHVYYDKQNNYEDSCIDNANIWMNEVIAKRVRSAHQWNT